ncbi:hypothetical protein JTB14_028807 [Gonioctena quinquepunctata]|nr:hypothetical protein JTB14_028807 [Gonioctena quinquepunctata]
MRDFSGFHLDKKSSEFAQKSHGENEKTDDEEVEEESEEEVDSDEDKNGNDRGAKSGESFGNTKLKGSFSLTFKDVEDSIRPFDGKDNYPVRKWIEDFEEISELTGWNDLQKLIFAKKSLKAFHSVRKRNNKVGDSKKKFFLKDDTSNKLVMYGAKTFGEFKEKVKLYEQITISRTKPGQERNKEGKHMEERTIETKKDKDEKRHRKTSMRLCFNCGDKGHLSNECPEKRKGRSVLCVLVMVMCQPNVQRRIIEVEVQI